MVVNAGKWDAAKYLRTPEDVQLFLNEAIEDGDPRFLVAALGVVARSQGMTEIAKRTSMGRESLYKGFSLRGNPSVKSFMAVLNAVDMKLSVDSNDRRSVNSKTSSAKFWVFTPTNPPINRKISKVRESFSLVSSSSILIPSPTRTDTVHNYLVMPEAHVISKAYS